ncbi:MAG: four helix bundle protein [Ruminococcus sp.]|nr:four helix bundle protein [Ruminococcus sp.]
MDIKSYKDLIVWQKSIDLVILIYELTKLLPEDEKFGLSSQMRRAAISIPSNIAEGQQRKSSKDFMHFLSIARGSKGELQTQLYISYKLKLLSKQQVEPSMALLSEIGKMISKLMDSLN